MTENKVTRAGAGAGRVSCLAADTRRVAFEGAQRHHNGAVDAIRLAYLRRLHGITEAQANALASLIWGRW